MKEELKKEWEVLVGQLASKAWKNGLWHSESALLSDLKTLTNHILAKQQEEFVKNPAYMDVSSWKNYGEKMGFGAYWEGRYSVEIGEIIRKAQQRFRCGACDGAKVGHTQCCQCLADIKSKLNI
jgi:hypothetical protein